MPRLTPRSKELLTESMRQSMREAVIEMLREKKLEEITIAAIAKRLKISSVTIYNYYRTRDLLIQDTFRATREHVLRKLREAAATTAEPEEKLHALAEIVFNDFDAHRYLFMARFSTPPTDEAGKNEAQKQFQDVLAVFTGIIREGIVSGDFRVISPENTAMMMLGAIMGINRHCLFGWAEMTIEERLDNFTTVLIGGLLTRGV